MALTFMAHNAVTEEVLHTGFTLHAVLLEMHATGEGVLLSCVLG